MGMSMTSQKRKKRNMSSERKTPTTPTSSIRSMMKNSFTRWLMLLPRRQDGDGREEGGQDHEEQADAVNAEMVVDRGLAIQL